jgi:hypothetical protein
MVIRDLDVLGIPFQPHEAQAELIVDSNAILPGSRAAQRLQPIAGQRREIPQIPRLMKLIQLPSRDLFYGLKPPRKLAREERFRFSIAEGSNRAFSV